MRNKIQQKLWSYKDQNVGTKGNLKSLLLREVLDEATPFF